MNKLVLKKNCRKTILSFICEITFHINLFLKQIRGRTIFAIAILNSRLPLYWIRVLQVK